MFCYFFKNQLEHLLAILALSYGTSSAAGVQVNYGRRKARRKSDLQCRTGNDIFSLGSTRYELLTLKPVITATLPAAAICELQTLRPIPLRTHDANIPLPLERIVLKCLQLDPIDRYSGADELAKDLDRFLEGLPVVARPPGQVRRTSRWILRHPQTSLRMIVGLCLSLIVLATGFWILQRQSGESWLRGPPSEDLVDSSTTTNLPSDLKSPEESPDMLRSNRNNRNIENRRNDSSTNRSLKFEELENRELMAGLTIATPLSLGAGVNTVDNESGPSRTLDGLSLLFTRYGAPNSPMQIFEATRSLTSSPFGNVVSAVSDVNADGFPGHPEVSRDGLTLLFSKDDNSGIYQATGSIRGQSFGSVTPLGDLLPGQPAIHPSLSADGLTLFFTAWDTSHIQNDIYQVTRLSASVPWGNVVMLSPAINVAGYNDAQPSISSDGLLLFFNSNRPGGFGAFDLYYATRPPQQSPWEPAINLGSKVNNASDDKQPNISPDGSLLYFHSSRPGGAGAEDLYQAQIIYGDSTKFYVVNDGSPDRTFEYSAGGGVIDNYTINSDNTAPRGAASTSAGDKVWVVDANKRVYVYDSNGGLLGSWSAGTLGTNATVQGIATNGTDVWIVDSKSDKVFKYTVAASRLSGSQNAASSFSLNGSNRSPTDIVTDGTSFWVVNDTWLSDRVFKYSLSGSLIGSWTISTPGVSSPTGITLNPVSPSELWIVDNGTDRVYQYNAAVGVTSGSRSASSSFALAAGNTNPQGIADPPPPSDSVRISNAVMTPPTASGFAAPMANSKASDIAFSRLSDDIVRSRASSPFERGRVSIPPILRAGDDNLSKIPA